MNVPVKFLCKRTGKTYCVSEDAVFGTGWLCDCGSFIDYDVKHHVVLLYGERDVFVKDKNVVVERCLL